MLTDEMTVPHVTLLAANPLSCGFRQVQHGSVAIEAIGLRPGKDSSVAKTALGRQTVQQAAGIDKRCVGGCRGSPVQLSRLTLRSVLANGAHASVFEHSRNAIHSNCRG